MHRSRLHRAARRALLVAVSGVVFTLVLSSALDPAGVEAEDERPETWWLYDAGMRFSRVADDGALPFELAIDYFTSGSPPVRWSASTALVPICTHHANRPSWITAEMFRAAVEAGVQAWSDAEAAVGYEYRGDCASGSTWTAGNRINEIGWDDGRNAVRPPAAAVTEGTWSVSPGQRHFLEADIVIARSLEVPEACFRSMIAHELGHGLGLGHSDTRGDLMFPSFDSANLATCPAGPSAAEITFLTDIYGVNRRPVIVPPTPVNVSSGTTAQLSVTATDPENDLLTYTWTQVSGPTVSLVGSGSTVTFLAPGESGSLEFEVAVRDRFLHRATATVLVNVEMGEQPVVDLGTFMGDFSGTGIGLLVWSGGLVEDAVAIAAGAGARSLWVTREGRFFGYSVGSPAFANAAFLSAYPDGVLPETPVLVVGER